MRQEVVAKKVVMIDNELFEKLRHLRRELAEAQHVPPFVIFSDQTLHEMCEKLPTDERAFLELKGVGHSKLEKYGKIFLDALTNYQTTKKEAH